MEKVLCVYYSRTGHIKQIVDELSKQFACDIEEITESKTRRGFFGFMRSAYESLKKKIVPINELTYNPSDYDLVIIATPLWAGGLSSPVRSYLHQVKEKLSTVAFVSSSGSQDANNLYVQMEEYTASKPIATLNITHKDLKGGIEEKVNKFISSFKK